MLRASSYPGQGGVACFRHTASESSSIFHPSISPQPFSLLQSCPPFFLSILFSQIRLSHYFVLLASFHLTFSFPFKSPFGMQSNFFCLMMVLTSFALATSAAPAWWSSDQDEHGPTLLPLGVNKFLERKDLPRLLWSRHFQINNKAIRGRVKVVIML